MSFRGTLRPYQQEAVALMKERGNLLLAFAQGTGKTVLTIAAIEDLFDSGQITEPGFIVCLSTLKFQWKREIEKFSDDSKVLVIDGTPAQRAEQYASAPDYDYVIVNYEQVVNEWEQVSRLPRGFLVVDEASFIKGFKSKRSRAVKRLAQDVTYRYALTGTPVENGRPEEFFSIMEFVDPTVFGGFRIFDQTFIVRNGNGWVKRYRNIPLFHKTLESAMVRKRATDPDVAPFMPTRIERPPMEVVLDRAARKVYEHIVADLLPDLEVAAAWGGSLNLAALYGQASSNDPARDALRGRIGQKILALQMLCDHPELLRISAGKFDARQGNDTSGSAYAAHLRDRGLLSGLTRSPKLDHTIRWVNETLETDPRNKIVIFSRYVDMVEITAAALGGIAETYTGRMTAKTKDAHLTRFQTDPGVRVLVASDAGGYGLDIPQANHVLNLDLPDGAGAADQRDTRHQRTSSEFPSVFVHWTFVKGSLEEQRYQRLAQKRAVAQAFVDKRGLTAKGGLELDAPSLLSFLRGNSV